jgi:hypothetical protein
MRDKGSKKCVGFKGCMVLICVMMFSVHAYSQISFTNVAGASGDQSNIAFNKDGGCSFADFDLDGDLDLLVNTSDNNATRRSYLLRNDNGVFTDVTNSIAPDLKANGLTERTAAWGDCNNDGYPDLLVNNSGRLKILLNSGGTSLSTIFEITGMSDGFNTEGAGWIDYDMDGDLDFFVENHNFGVDIFDNDGAASPTFTQVTINSVGAAGTGAGGIGLPEGGSTTGDYGTASDLNLDGYPDLLVRRQNSGPVSGQDQNRDDIFINDGDGTFTANTSLNEQAANGNKGGVIAGDFDSDGDFDILWTSASLSGNLAVVYENTGLNSMVFNQVANPLILDNGTAENGTDFDGCAIGDIDNDGDLDLFMTQNSGTSKLYLNLSSGPGNFSFRQPGPTWIPGAAINYGINVNGNGEGCVFADYDNDGDVDLYVNRSGGNQLWENDYIGSATEAATIHQNNYLRVIPLVDLGGGITRPAVNATVRFLDCDGNTLNGVREIGSGGAGHGSQTSPWLIYGLPDGPDESYLLEVQFTRNGTTPVIVRKAVIPSELPDLNLGTSTLTMEQTIVITDSDADDILDCPEICADGMDNDGDGLIDCEDPECNLRGNGYDWYFGQNAALDFEFASGPEQVFPSSMNTDEGCAQWSDSTGRMLFYTNGVTIYNRFHDPMPNGTGLVGDPSSSQSGVIVQDPGNADRYYVFCVNSSPYEVRYALVDMTLDGGKGDVISGQKNILVQSVTGEKLAAWPHANGTDFWVIMSDDSNLYAYQLTSTGLSPVVTSAAATASRRYGYMKFSPDGSRIAVCNYPASGSSFNVQLYDFDDATGVFSNQVQWAHPEPYGVEFSPNGKLLYVTEMGWGSSGSLSQYVLEGNLTGAEILASKTDLLADSYMHAALQIGPDGKIYMATSTTGNNPRNGLAVINEPNVEGLGANAVADQITFTGGAMSRSGLPNVPYYQLNTEPVTFFASATDTCLAQGTVVLEATASGATGLQWLMDGSPLPGETNSTYTPTVPGAYQVVATYACETDTSEAIVLGPDNDGDCVPDDVDLDDDNDGIPDADEGCGNLVINGDFEAQDFSDATEFPNGFTEAGGTFIGTSFNTNPLIGWTYDQNLDGWVGGASMGWTPHDFAAAKKGTQFVDILGNNNHSGGVNNTLSQTFATEIGETYQLRFYWGEDVGHPAGSTVTLDFDVQSATAVSLLSETLQSTALGEINGVIGPKVWIEYEGTFIATSPTTTLYFTATPPGGSTSAGAALDAVSVKQVVCPDSDGDGVSDSFDLDSDNDGIYDAVEAGHGEADADQDGVIDGSDTSSGPNGLYDQIETSAESGVIDYIVADTDGDGIIDAQEIDSDDDACFDVVEANYTDADEDGEVDGGGYDGNGLVTGSDGYNGTQPGVTDPTAVAVICDSDGDNIAVFVDIDDDNDGIPDIQEQDCNTSIPGTLGTPTTAVGGTRVTTVYTDFGGYWTSSVGSISAIQPNIEHSLIAFTSGGVTYSTGAADDNMLDQDLNGLYEAIDTDLDGNPDITCVESLWNAIPPALDITGKTVLEGSAMDGNAGAALGTTLVVDYQTDQLNNYLVNGKNGLGLNTVLANVGDSWYYPVGGIVEAAINDGEPDLMMSQVAQPTSVVQTVTFFDAGGNVVGNAVSLDAQSGELSYSAGQYRTDVYFNSGSTSANEVKNIRLATIEFSEMGINSSNAGDVAIMRLELTANADVAFTAYNQRSFTSICEDRDTDGDGIVDRLDLDSDNDGIFDVVEGGDGASDTNGDGQVNSSDTGYADSDLDGMDDTTEGTAPTDSDVDGAIDAIELDSDDDGCNDVIEAGFQDPDGDGILGN